MKTLTKIYTLALPAVMTVALAGPAVWAQSPDSGINNQSSSGDQGTKPGFGGRHKHRAHMQESLMQKLGLTDAQKEQVKQIRASHRANLAPLMQQLRAKRQEIRQSTQSGTFDEALVTQKLTEAAGLQAKLMGERFKIHQEMLSVLTPDQKAKLDELRAQFRSKHQGHGANKVG